jgi:hypothetical protein
MNKVDINIVLMTHSVMIQVERSWILSGIILQIKPNGAMHGNAMQ